MSRWNYETLNDPENAAKELSAILTKHPFKSTIEIESSEKGKIEKVDLNLHLNDLDETLKRGKITAEDYFKNPAVAQAIKLIKPRNNYYFHAMRELWCKQSSSFSIYEKIFIAMSTIMLITGVVLSYENYVLFVGGEKLKKTENNVQAGCNGLSSTFSDVCSSLGNGMQAAFSMDQNNNGEPFYSGSSNNTLTVPIKEIPSLFNPFSWFNWFACNTSSDGSAFQIMGDTFSGSPEEVQSHAANGIFPVVRLTGINETIALTVSTFLFAFCITIQKGGDSIIPNPITGIPYGHTPGFELPAKDFGIYARIFGALDGFFVGLALVTMVVLLAKKAIEKWQGASCMWKACEIYKKSTLPENLSPSNHV